MPPKKSDSEKRHLVVDISNRHFRELQAIADYYGIDLGGAVSMLTKKEYSQLLRRRRSERKALKELDGVS